MSEDIGTGTIFGQYGGSVLQDIPSLPGFRHQLECVAYEFMPSILYCSAACYLSQVLLSVIFLSVLPIYYCIVLFVVLSTICPKVFGCLHKGQAAERFRSMFS